MISKGMAKIGLVFLGLAALLLASILIRNHFHDSDRPDYQRLRDTAAALEARCLYTAALDELDRYRGLAGPTMTPADEADLLYKMAKMADEKLSDCDRALAWYTMADALCPDAPWSAESGKRSVVCLDKVGKSKESAALLTQLTGGTAPATPAADGPVVAVVDGRSVTWDEVQAAWPPHPKEESMDLAARQKMVEEYVVTLLLSEEAVRKGYDSDPAAQARLEWSRRQALAAALVTRDLHDPADAAAMQKLIDEIVKLHHVRIFKDVVPQP